MEPPDNPSTPTLEEELCRIQSQFQAWAHPTRLEIAAARADLEDESAELVATLEPKELLRLSELPAGSSRRAEWLAARKARARACGVLGVAHAATSLSHTSLAGERWAVAAALDRTRASFNVGIDWEDSRRPLAAEVVARFAHSDELVSELQALDLWVLKEAAFKADPDNIGKVIWQYRVADWNALTQEGSGRLPGGREARLKLARSTRFRLALAIV